MSGICAAAKLAAAGVHDVVVYEKADRVGGTWRENTYPGLACDVPSRYYCYTFAPNPDWTHVFPPGHEVQAYLEKVADDLRLRPRIRFGAEIEEAVWTDRATWLVRTRDGEAAEYDFLISAAGVLHHPPPPAGTTGLRSTAGGWPSSAPDRPACRSPRHSPRAAESTSCSSAPRSGSFRS